MLRWWCRVLGIGNAAFWLVCAQRLARLCPWTHTPVSIASGCTDRDGCNLAGDDLQNLEVVAVSIDA